MSRFKPQLTIITDETIREARNKYPIGSYYKTIQYPTYKELKKNLKKHMEENLESPLCVIRSKRGEWGEWFENWKFGANGKPYIDREGWM